MTTSGVRASRRGRYLERAKEHGIAAVAALLIMTPQKAQGQIVGVAARLKVFKELADLAGATGEAIDKLTKGVQTAVGAGHKGLTCLQAQRTRDALVRFKGEVSGLSAGQHQVLLPTWKAYLDKPSPDAWRNFDDAAGSALSEARGLLETLSKNGSDFVLEHDYDVLRQALLGRVTLLGRLANVGEPKTRAERSAFRAAYQRYRRLLTQLDSGTAGLAAYTCHRSCEIPYLAIV